MSGYVITGYEWLRMVRPGYCMLSQVRPCYNMLSNVRPGYFRVNSKFRVGRDRKF